MNSKDPYERFDAIVKYIDEHSLVSYVDLGIKLTLSEEDYSFVIESAIKSNCVYCTFSLAIKPSTIGKSTIELLKGHEHYQSKVTKLKLKEFLGEG